MAHEDDSSAREQHDLDTYFALELILLSVLDAFGPLSQPVPPATFDALHRAESHLARFGAK